MADSRIKIIKDSAFVSFGRFISAFVAAVRGFVVAKFLGPEMFGILNILNLVQLYASYFNPGLQAAASREMPFLKAKNDLDAYSKVKNTFISTDFIITLCLALAITVFALFLDNIVLKIALVLTALLYIILRIRGYFELVARTDRKFVLLTKVNIIYSLVISVLIIASVYWFGLYSVLGFPILISIGSIFYLRKYIRIDLSFSIDKVQFFKLLRIGMPLFLGSIAFTGIRFSDRTIVAIFLGPVQLGLYSLGTYFVNLFRLISAGFSEVIVPYYQHKLGTSKEVLALKNYAIKPGIVFSTAFSFLIGVLLLSIHLLIFNFLPKYIDSLMVIKMSLLTVFPIVMNFFPSYVLNSSIVNKQTAVMLIWWAGTAVNIFLNLLFILQMNWGINGIALATLISNVFILLSIYLLSNRYIIESLREAISYYFGLLFPLIYTLCICLLFWKIFGYEDRNILNIFSQILIFSILYIPVIVYMELKTGIFKISRTILGSGADKEQYERQG